MELDTAEGTNIRLNEFDLADPYSTDDEILIKLLIGLGYYWSIVMGEMFRTSPGPAAIASKVGYILSGPIEDRKCSNIATSACATRAPPITKSMTNAMTIDLKPDEITKSLNKFWDTESLGVVKEEFLKPNEVRIRHNGIRYEVELPWKKKYPDISDNYILAKKRSYSQTKRSLKHPEMLDKYNQIIKKQDDAGIIEEVPKYNTPTAEKTYYMPHQLVVRESKVTTNLRIVYDASSKLHGKSFNESLKNIPTKHTDLFSVLLQFRVYKVALIADIEKAFFTIGVKETDRDALRFLWVEDLTDSFLKIKEKIFTRVCFAVISSMGHLEETINHHLDKYRNQMSEVIEKIKNSLYLDDLSTGADDPKGAIELYKAAKSVFAEANINLRK